jgi:hypothetical protein
LRIQGSGSEKAGIRFPDVAAGGRARINDESAIGLSRRRAFGMIDPRGANALSSATSDPRLGHGVRMSELDVSSTARIRPGS